MNDTMPTLQKGQTRLREDPAQQRSKALHFGTLTVYWLHKYPQFVKMHHFSCIGASIKLFKIKNRTFPISPAAHKNPPPNRPRGPVEPALQEGSFAL